MAARAISSGTISFGLVSIPVKLYTAASSEQVSFNMLHAKCGGRIKQQLFCPTDNEIIGRNDTVKGFEYARGQFVTFTEEELKSLEAERSNSIEIVEFVPLSGIDFLQVERSYYLGPDKGGDKAYRLLGEAMRVTDRVAVGRWSARGKEQLILIRPYGKDGLVFHQLYYQHELRAFEEIDTGATFTFSEKEQELAKKLIEQLSADKFDASPYRDSFSDRVRAAVEQKVAGSEVTVAPEEPKAQIIDLFEALKRSLKSSGDAAALARDAEPAPLKKAEPRKRPVPKKSESGSA
ncbi:MAG: Ku protein [Polyangiaceae bacterium]|nr:Ku protein [Polyangiaceae bacterium]